MEATILYIIFMIFKSLVNLLNAFQNNFIHLTNYLSKVVVQLLIIVTIEVLRIPIKVDSLIFETVKSFV